MTQYNIQSKGEINDVSNMLAEKHEGGVRHVIPENDFIGGEPRLPVVLK